jgi:hypothetical protein
VNRGARLDALAGGRRHVQDRLEVAGERRARLDASRPWRDILATADSQRSGTSTSSNGEYGDGRAGRTMSRARPVPLQGEATMKTACVFLLAVMVVVSAGCATKRYGRMTTLTSKEADVLSCPRIEEEIVECEVFLADVYSTSFSGEDVLAILGDFGIGNLMERDAALKSGKDRLEGLYELRKDKCDIPVPPDWLDQIKADARLMAQEKAAQRKQRAKESRHQGDYIVTPPPDEE